MEKSRYFARPDELYANGYINVPFIARRPTWLKLLIGARQVGKTYGVLKHHIDADDKFILLRRTTDELNFIASNPDYNPFLPYEPDYHISLRQGKEKNYTIYDEDRDESRGVAISLPQVAKIRGFNGSAFKAVVYDEAIPEKGVRTLKTEGDSLLNAYMTIAGNREKEGKPPLILWLLANTNNINSPILDALNLIDPLIYMRGRGLEYWEGEGASIFFGKSCELIAERKKNALARQINPDSSFARMAYGNEWGYDESPLISPKSLKGLTPLCSLGSDFYLWETSGGIGDVYVCTAPHKKEHYPDDNFNKSRFITNYAWLARWYLEGYVSFANIKLLNVFKNLFGINY